MLWIPVKLHCKITDEIQDKTEETIEGTFWDAGLKTRFVYTGNINLWGIACGKNKMQRRGTCKSNN